MQQKKNGILLVAFGASTPVAQKTLTLFEKRIREVYPNTTVRWAFTSQIVRNRMAEAKKKTDSVQKALMRMIYEKYTTIAVQSLHTIPGTEYDSLLHDVEKITQEEKDVTISVGKPLLFTQEDIKLTAQALLSHIPSERTPEEAVLCMGHGTWHEGGGSYEALEKVIAAKDPLVYIGTLEGKAGINSFIPLLKDKEIHHVWLMPLLSVIGKHAEKDMVGEQQDSWRSTLVEAGFSCTPVLKGTAEYDEFISIWAEHLTQTIKKLHTSW